MNKSSCMKQLDQCSSAIANILDPPTKACGEKNKHRPHLLPLARNDIMSDSIQQRDTAAHGCLKTFFKFIHHRRYGSCYFGKRKHSSSQLGSRVLTLDLPTGECRETCEDLLESDIRQTNCNHEGG